ncbi:hypothetical protein [Nocardioides sp.]|uniref:hypothetical protein n=1 Tax=Nocardioides sp. TaxID=35761 RepID=UPI002B8A3B23|nr:hypothetical protein [Nocardioides sp.]HXH79884.1 hypothetical protein [Nocardioides sp.]
MTFDLINLNSFVFGFVVLAGLVVLLAVGALAESLTVHRRVRLARQATIPAYYGNLLGAH